MDETTPTPWHNRREAAGPELNHHGFRSAQISVVFIRRRMLFLKFVSPNLVDSVPIGRALKVMIVFPNIRMVPVDRPGFIMFGEMDDLRAPVVCHLGFSRQTRPALLHQHPALDVPKRVEMLPLAPKDDVECVLIDLIELFEPCFQQIQDGRKLIALPDPFKIQQKNAGIEIGQSLGGSAKCFANASESMPTS